MEFPVVGKSGKYTVQDKSGRLIYSIKKKGFGARYNLMDASNYNLYTLVQTGDSKRPFFTIILNDNVFMSMECASLFLNPTIKARNKTMRFEITSKDRKNFDILLNDDNVGTIQSLMGVNGEMQYHFNIDNKAFDDYIALFAIAIDRAFGEMNK